MRRRAFLAATGSSLVALAGCFGPDADGGGRAGSPRTSGPDAGTATATETPTPTPGGPTAAYDDVSVESAIQQHGYVQTYVDVLTIAASDEQFVRVDVVTPGEGPDRDDFRLSVGDTTHSPADVSRFYPTAWGDRERYEAGRDRGVLAFRVDPPSSPRPVSLSWPGGEWRADEALAARIARGPQPTTAELDVPAEHGGSEAPPVDVRITNEGEATGRFIGALNRSGPLVAYAPVEHLSVLLEPGETRTVTVDDGWSGSEAEWKEASESTSGGTASDEADVTYTLATRDGDVEAGIRLV